MTYMMMIKMKEGALNGPPPQELMDAVGAQIEKYQKEKH